MAFMLNYKCESCGNEIWSMTSPAEWDCPCYIPEQKIYEGSGIEQKIGKTERKARYRHQYALNQYSWGGKSPKMYMGAFEEYKDINKEET